MTEALVFRSGARPQLERVLLGALAADELLEAIYACGICHTDISCMNGTLPARMPQILGHEGHF